MWLIWELGGRPQEELKSKTLYNTEFLWSRAGICQTCWATGQADGQNPKRSLYCFLHTYRLTVTVDQKGSLRVVHDLVLSLSWPKRDLSFHFLTISRTKNYYMFITHFFFLVFLCFWKHWGSCWPGSLLLSCAPAFCGRVRGRVRNDLAPVIHLCFNHFLASQTL